MLFGGKACVTVLALTLVVGCVLAAQEAGKDGDKGTAKPAAQADQLVTTQHALTIKGKKLNYTATAGYLTLKDDQQKPTANIFFIAYTLDGADAGKRPVTFAF